MTHDNSSELQRHPLVPAMQTDRPDDDMAIVAELNLRVRRNGAMSIEGFTGDKKFALAMLANAVDAIRRQPEPSALVVPGRDVELPPFAPFGQGA